ncbi:hypothetical protein JCM21900_002320 [Sporobolomyces salmonicolor]
MLSLDLSQLDVHYLLVNWPAPGSHDGLILVVLYGLVTLATLVALITFLSDPAHKAADWIRTAYRRRK